MEFVALLSTGKGTWGQVIGLINRSEWDKVIILGDSYVKKRFAEFNIEKKVEFIEINFSRSIKEIIEEIIKKLKNKITGPEIALSIASGTGKEHMALIAALLRIPVGIRFCVLTKEGIMYF